MHKLTFLCAGLVLLAISILVPVAFTQQVPGASQSPVAKTEENTAPIRHTGTFLAVVRTNNHISRSRLDKFEEATDGFEKFLVEQRVPIVEDPVRKKFRIEGSMSKASMLNVARDSGAKYLLVLWVDRPATSWIELRAQCFDPAGQLQWEERASGNNQFSSAGHIEKALKKMDEKLRPHVGKDCLSSEPTPGGSAK